MQVKILVEKFLSYCEKHRSPATVRHYRSRLKSFQKRFAEREFADLSPLEIEEYLDDVNYFAAGRPKAPDTQRANIVTFETLQNWALHRKIIPQRVIGPLEKPASRFREVIPTEEEIDKILSAGSPEFRLIYSALLVSGARPGELCKAQISNIAASPHNPDLKLIVLHDHKTARKTKKPRRIPIGRQLAALISESIGDRTEGPLFLSPRGKPWTTQRLSQTFRTLRERLGLPKHLCLYLTRHQHASVITAEKGIYAASKSLGHASITTTQRYAKTNDEELVEIQDVYPLKKSA